jgi:glycosyltransferase involved in cell wall biosynthesis
VTLVVLHVLAPAPFGGLERVVAALATGHGARGLDVHVAGVFEGGGRVTPLPIDGAPGVTQHILTIPRRRYDIERRDVAALGRAIGASILHTHGYRPDVVDAPLARRLGARCVTTVHGFTGGGLKNRLFERLQVRAFHRMDAVVAVSRLLATQLAARGVPPARLHVIPNAWAGLGAPPEDRAAARAALGVARDVPVVGWVGRLSREKAADVLLEALPHVGGAWHAVFVGTGPEQPRLEARAAALGLAQRITWRGDMPQAGRYFPAFDVFVLSSRTEGTPIALFEAMAAGVPVVATRVGGVPDVVTEREAWLVPPEHAGALAAAVQEALDRPVPAAARAAAARTRLDAAFGAAAWLDRYESLYRSLTTEVA